MPGPGIGSSAGKPTPRQSGGFRPAMGSFNNEHMDESAMQAAVGQKQANQQTTNSTQATTGGSAHKTQGSKSDQAPKAPPQKPRELGTIQEELVARPLKDIAKEIKGFFSLNKLLNIDLSDPPEVQAKKKAIQQRWNKLDQEQQSVAKKAYQEKMQKKQLDEQEEERKKQVEAQKEQQSIAPPSSTKKGPVGPAGSNKQKATQQLQQNRQTIGKMAGSN